MRSFVLYPGVPKDLLVPVIVYTTVRSCVVLPINELLPWVHDSCVVSDRSS